LIVNGRPSTYNVLTGAIFSTAAELGLRLELVHQLDSVGVFFLEQPLVIVVDHLKLVGEGMCANLIRLEQIDFIGLGVDMEVPYTEHLASQTMYWLISSYYK
jgi:hypothetical protein